MFLIFDTETTGKPLQYDVPAEDLHNWPRVVQLAWQLHDEKGRLLHYRNYIIRPDGFTIPYNAVQIHGITTERALKEGIELKTVLWEFNEALGSAHYLVAHNISFDVNTLSAEYIRCGIENKLKEKTLLDTQQLSTEYCALPGGKGGKYKWPRLDELYQKLFGESFSEAHNAAADVEATARCFFRLLELHIIQLPGITIEKGILQHLEEVRSQILGQLPQRSKAPDTSSIKETVVSARAATVSDDLLGNVFVHLHCHSQFSLQPSTSAVEDLVHLAKQYDMPAVALTDHGNMYGAFYFATAAQHAGIKPIIGCEFYLCRDRFDKRNKDDGYHQVLIAKNKNGYQHLIKLSSKSFVEGFYYVPRIDKELLLQYKDDLIATTGSIYSEIPSLLLNVGESQAEKAFLWWKETFGDNFYVEINRHGLKEEEYVNQLLLKWCHKYQVKYFAANNTYYNAREDADTHDTLLCIIEGELKTTPVGKGRGYRYGFPNDQFYFRSPKEMCDLFRDLPEAIATTREIADKVEVFNLKREVLLPRFDIPAPFHDENEYLRYLTYEGAQKRYGTINPELQSRIDMELETIIRAGYAGYFLIVQDLTTKAREMNVSVGPGRGSAAGSVVAYCIGITNVDPLKYNLLFERFLNPERVSMPDIDIDFDDRGRSKVMRYVLEKYGRDRVAQIITYGTMAARSAIRNVARVLSLPLDEADKLANAFPDFLTAYEQFKKSPLRTLITQPDKLEQIKSNMPADKYRQAVEFKEISKLNTLQGQTLRQAAQLEGTLRTTGVHACGVIITPDDITNYVPVKSTDASEISLITQYDNDVAEPAGLLKMDFLGLNTLTIISDALEIIKNRHGISLNLDDIPLDDPQTYGLFQRGETVGIFQYESQGMQKHLKNLKPDKFEDLIAMNALYRPGPMAYIDTFIKRKQGIEPIHYDLPEMEEVLKETYGVTVYQEQVMLLSQKLAGFSKGMADELRKAMGKKIRSKLDQLKPLFIDGCLKKGHDVKIAHKIWKDWESFAEYAFNKSHSTCYAVLAFQTAYLKVHYPAEYMAAVLSNNMHDIKEVAFFMEECRRMGLKVLGPDINESLYRFTVNEKGEIRFGLGAIKGVGEGAVDCIVQERTKNGPYKDIFDFTVRVDLRQANKKTIEALVLSGAFDCFHDMHRAQYFAEENMTTLIEKAIRYGNMVQENKKVAHASLFGDSLGRVIAQPRIPVCEEWAIMEKLNKEKEVLGMYISEHPLDAFRYTIKTCCNASLADLNEIDKSDDDTFTEKLRGKELRLAGMVTDFSHNTAQNGKPYGILTVEDYVNAYRFYLFGDDYINYRKFFNQGDLLFIRGRIQPRWDKRGDSLPSQHAKRKERLEFRVSHISLLAEALAQYCKSLTIKIPVDQICPELTNKLVALFEAHPGNAPIHVQLVDTPEKTVVTLTSYRFRVELNDTFYQQLSAIPSVELSLS